MAPDLAVGEKIAQILGQVSKDIRKAPYVKKVILFGSYSKKSYTDESDIDIAVFIEDGAESILNEFKRVTFLCLGYGVDIQPQVFYEKELDEPIGIVEEIVESGVELIF